MKGEITTVSVRTLIALIASVFVAGLVVGGGSAAAVSAHATHRATRVTTVKVSTHNSRYVLSPKTAPPGVVIFKVSNPASEPHYFYIKGRTTPLLRTGQSATLRVTFRRKGRYPYKDTFDHHAQFGCRGVFTIS